MILSNSHSQVRTLPRIELSLNGQLIDVGELGTLVEVLVQQRLSRPTLCELLWVESAPAARQPRFCKIGEWLELKVVDQVLFKGDITAISYEYCPERGHGVRLRAYDRLHRLRKRQPVRVLDNLTPADLARSLVHNLGLDVSAVVEGPRWQKLTQWRQSDFDLLATVCERCGLYFDLRGDTLHLMSLAGSGAALQLELNEAFEEARVEFNADVVCSTVTTSAWDPSRVELRVATASTPRSALSPAGTAPADVGGDGLQTMIGDQLRDDSQAQAIAQGELDRRRARDVIIWGIVRGNPMLRPGMPVDLKGITAAAEGIYIVTTVTHTIDALKGYVSEISSTPPPPPVRSNGASSAWGVVTSVDDPDGLGRVRVSLPAHRDLDSDWLGVLSPGAGANRGLVWLPSRGDQVLILFAGDDPSQGVVIGGLFGSQGALDRGGVEKGAVNRYSFVTPGGRKICLDDGAQSIRMETGDGSVIELSPKLLKVHAASDLTIEAPGKTITIRGKAVRFKKA